MSGEKIGIDLLQARVQSSLSSLVGLRFDILSIPTGALAGFEPAHIGTIVGTLMDACIPFMNEIITATAPNTNLGLTRAPGDIKDRDSYPDYLHESGARIELKLIYVDPNDGVLKRPETPREPSARLTQKVTLKNVVAETDLLLVVAYQLVPAPDNPDRYSPVILDFALFPTIECVRARDHRLLEAGGKWFGEYDTPTILSRLGKARLAAGEELDQKNYGRKESEGRDYNEDTNFGKLKRIPLMELQRFLRKCEVEHMKSGTYPNYWEI